MKHEKIHWREFKHKCCTRYFMGEYDAYVIGFIFGVGVAGIVLIFN